jgi:hypothetical protein
MNDLISVPNINFDHIKRVFLNIFILMKIDKKCDFNCVHILNWFENFGSEYVNTFNVNVNVNVNVNININIDQWLKCDNIKSMNNFFFESRNRNRIW